MSNASHIRKLFAEHTERITVIRSHESINPIILEEFERASFEEFLERLGNHLSEVIRQLESNDTNMLESLAENHAALVVLLREVLPEGVHREALRVGTEALRKGYRSSLEEGS